MIAAISLVYCLIVWLVFSKLKLVRTSSTTIGIAAVIGIVLIGAIVILWQFSSPNSSKLVVSRYVVQIVPQVKGPIEKIHAQPNEMLKEGEDILFEIQKDPFQYVVDQLTADLEAAKETVSQSEAAVQAAKAAIAKSEATLAASKAGLDVAKETEKLNPDAIAKLEVVQLTQQYNANEAAVDQAKASEEQAEFALKAAKQRVQSVDAQLKNAEFNLQQCTVYAPRDGFVVNWQVREGTMAVSLPLAPVGTFVDTSEVNLVANFGQNVVKFVKSGDPIEVSLKSRPGQVFTGTVRDVVRASGEGQFVTTGVLESAADIGSDGMIAVTFDLDDEELAKQLGMGTAGSVAIYTDHGKPFHIISKVVVRMNALTYYLIPK